MKRKNRKTARRVYIYIALVFLLGVFCAGAGKIGADKKLNSINDYIPARESEPEPYPPSNADFLILVNKQNPISENFIPEGLVNLSDLVPATKSVINFNAKAAADYASMISEMKEKSLYIYAVSGYRTYGHQANLYRQKVVSMKKNAEDAEIEAGKIVAPPGASEHQTGLALDVSVKSVNYALVTGFYKTDEYKWLYDNCHRYGFVIRYPANKTSLTDIIFEPWHLRYVGAEHAAAMYDAGLCLEEYVLRLNTDVKEDSDDF